MLPCSDVAVQELATKVRSRLRSEAKGTKRPWEINIRPYVTMKWYLLQCKRPNMCIIGGGVEDGDVHKQDGKRKTQSVNSDLVGQNLLQKAKQKLILHSRARRDWMRVTRFSGSLVPEYQMGMP